MWQYNYVKPNELYHYGILGMRWGVRRGSSSSGTSSRRYRGYSDEYKRAAKMKKRGIKKLSNDELKELNNRLALEKQYKDATKTRIQKGVAFLATAAAVTGSAVKLYENSDKLVGIGKKFLKKGN